MLQATENLQKIVETRTDAITASVQAFSKEQVATLERIRKESEEQAKELDEPLRREILYVKISLEELSVQSHKAAKSGPSVLISHYIRLFGLTLETGWSWKFSGPLQLIEASLKDGAKLTGSEITSLTKILDKLPPEFCAKGDAIRRLIPDAMTEF